MQGGDFVQEIIACDSYGNSLTGLVQWDSDVYVYLNGEEIDEAYRVHFFNDTMKEALVVESEYADGVLKAKIPNLLLTQPYIITGYVNVVKNGEAKSLYGFKINIRKKPKPSSYVTVDSKDWVEVTEVLAECHEYANSALQSEQNAKIYSENASDSADEADNYSLLSKSYAIGEGNKRDNEATDNSKYYYEQSKANANLAETSVQNAQQLEGIIKTHVSNAASSAEQSELSAQNASASADEAKNIAEEIGKLLKKNNTVIDDVTHITYFIGIENGVVYFSDEFE